MIYDVNGTPTGIAYYDTVAAMKAAAPAVGTVVATGGYYAKGDGGAAMYSVSDAAGATVNGCTSFTSGGRVFEMLDDGRELNVLKCGMRADGTTDNLAIFGLIKAAYPVRTLYFPAGVYAFAGSLVFDRCYCILDNAELKCTSPGIVGRFVEIRGQMYPPEHPQDDMFIKGNGIINANFKANTCLAVARQKHTLIDGVHIKNFQRYGIMSKFTDDSLGQNLSYELEVTDCLITNELSYSDAIGIVDFNDSTYTDIVILNVKTAIQASGSSVFHNIHAWCYDFDNSDNRAELLTDTVFARITDNGARFSDCYCDTYQKGFVFASNISLAYVSNFKWFINLETWPDGVTPVAFNAGTNKTEYKVFGARVPKQGITKFSDVSLTGTGCEFYGVVSDADNAPTT
nr:MAG TPA: rhamnogalacturonase A [Bacteriophage sp.]